VHQKGIKAEKEMERNLLELHAQQQHVRDEQAPPPHTRRPASCSLNAVLACCILPPSCTTLRISHTTRAAFSCHLTPSCSPLRAVQEGEMMGLEQRRDDALLLEAEAAVQLVALPPTPLRALPSFEEIRHSVG